MKIFSSNQQLQLNINLKLTSDKLAVTAAVLYFSGAAVRFALSNTIGKIGLSGAVNYVYMILLIWTVLLCVLGDRRRIKASVIFLVLLVALAVYFEGTLVIHPEYEYYFKRDTVGVWDELFSPVTGCIYGLLVILLCLNSENVWKSLKYCAWIDLVYYTIRVILANKTGYWTGYDASGNVINTLYDLGVGYNIMFVSIIFLCKYNERKKIIDLAAAVYSLILVLSNGSRGALICLGLFIILTVVCKNDTKQMELKHKIKIFFLLAAVIFILVYFDVIIIAMGKMLSSFGINSRTINAMLSGTLLSDNGRETITERALIAIKNGGILGLGAFGDRPYIAPYYWWGYCHNIILEIMCDFGTILGSILILTLFGSLLRVLFAHKSNSYRYVYIIFFSICGKLFVSDTIWGYPQFWALLGVLILFSWNKGDKDRLYMEDT